MLTAFLRWWRRTPLPVFSEEFRVRLTIRRDGQDYDPWDWLWREGR
jgi:hypothetical protein